MNNILSALIGSVQVLFGLFVLSLCVLMPFSDEPMDPVSMVLLMCFTAGIGLFVLSWGSVHLFAAADRALPTWFVPVAVCGCISCFGIAAFGVGVLRLIGNTTKPPVAVAVVCLLIGFGLLWVIWRVITAPHEKAEEESRLPTP